MKPAILLVGCGRFGKNHLRVLKKLHEDGTIILKGVITAREETGEKIREEHNVETFSDLTDDLLESVDAVDITTPASTHFQIAKRCLEYSHVFVEKPLTLSIDEMEELKRLSEKSGKRIMVGHIFRFNQAVWKLKEFVNDRISSLKHIEGVFVGAGEPPKDCGAIPTFLHLFDVLEYILENDPDSVLCKEVREGEEGFDEYARLALQYGGGYSAELEMGWEDERKERSFLFRFDEEEIFCDMLDQRITIKGKGDTDCMEKEPLLIEIEHFVKVVKGDEKLYPGVDTAIKVQKVIDSSYRSIKTGETEEVR